MSFPAPATSEQLFESVTVEWRIVQAELVRRRRVSAERVMSLWETVLPALETEFLDLVAQGGWQRGSDDMFSILRLQRNEIRHSAMIAWLLDPIGRHGLGSAFLRGILEQCYPSRNIAVGGATTVVCEVARGDTRADTVVWSRDFTLIIENKVDAGEGHRQCDRIFHHFGEEPGALFLFVTPTGRRPKTATGDAAAAFVTLSYHQIRILLHDLTTDRQAVATVGQSTVLNYLETLRKEFP